MSEEEEYEEIAEALTEILVRAVAEIEKEEEEQELTQDDIEREHDILKRLGLTGEEIAILAGIAKVEEERRKRAFLRSSGRAVTAVAIAARLVRERLKEIDMEVKAS